MSNFLLLSKINILSSLDFMSGKKNRTKGLSALAFIFVMMLIIAGASGFLTFIFTKAFDEIGIKYYPILLYFGGLVVILEVSTSILSVKNTFGGKDYDMLRAMPISKSTIISSKLFGVYVTALAYSFVLLFPSALVLTIFSKDFNYLWIGTIMVILSPGIPLIVSSLLAMFITLIADRYKIGNIISMALYMLFFLAIFYISFTMSSKNTSDGGEFGSALMNMMWFNPTLYFIKLGFEKSLINVLYFVLINAGALFLIMMFLSLLYDKLHAITTGARANYKYERKELKNKSEFKTLLANEIKKITKSRLYFINSIMSGISSVTMVIVLYISLSKGLDNPNVLAFIKAWGHAACIAIIFAIGIQVPSGSSISMEGSNFWMIKVYPINIKKLMKAKIIASIIFTLPSVLISTTILVVLLKLDPYAIVMNYLISTAYCILVSLIGLMVNMAFPKLKWKTENEVLKNSASVTISMLIDFGITILIAGALIGLTFINRYLATAVGLSLTVLACAIIYALIIKRCEKVIENYEL